MALRNSSDFVNHPISGCAATPTSASLRCSPCRHPSPGRPIIHEHLWRNPEPKPAYDVVIIGGGGHGLATAYYLAKQPRDHERRRPRARLAGRRERRPQHDRHPLELPVGRVRGDLRARAEAVGRAVRGARLRPAVQPARRAQPRPQPARRARGHAAGQREPAQRRRRRMARPRRRPASARSSTSRPRSATRPRRHLQRRGGIAKHDHVAWGWRARPTPRRGPDPGLRGHGLRRRATVAPWRADRSRADRGRAGRARLRRPYLRGGRDGRDPPAAAVPSRCRRWCRSCWSRCSDYVVMSNTVHVYVSQAHKGELVMGAGIDSYNSYAQRGAFHVIEAQMAAAHRAVPDVRRAHVIRTWAGSWTSPPTRRRSSASRPVDACTSTRAGARAGSRRRRARAGCTPTRSPTASRTPQRTVRPGPVHLGRPHRRARRRGGGALMRARACWSCCRDCDDRVALSRPRRAVV